MQRQEGPELEMAKGRRFRVIQISWLTSKKLEQTSSNLLCEKDRIKPTIDNQMFKLANRREPIYRKQEKPDCAKRQPLAIP